MKESKWTARAPKKQKFRPWTRVSMRIKGQLRLLHKQRSLTKKYKIPLSVRIRELLTIRSFWVRLAIVVILLEAVYLLQNQQAIVSFISL